MRNGAETIRLQEKAMQMAMGGDYPDAEAVRVRLFELESRRSLVKLAIGDDNQGDRGFTERLDDVCRQHYRHGDGQ